MHRKFEPYNPVNGVRVIHAKPSLIGGHLQDTWGTRRQVVCVSLGWGKRCCRTGVAAATGTASTQASIHERKQALVHTGTHIRMNVRSNAKDARMHELMHAGAHVRTGERTDERMQGRKYVRVHTRVGPQTRMHVSPPAAPTPRGPEIG